MVNQTLHCIKEHTAGCTVSPALLPIRYATKKYLDLMNPYVYIPEKTPEGDDHVSRVTRCTFKFMDDFVFVMASSNNFSEAMCHLYATIEDECNKMDDIPSVLQPGMKVEEKIWMGMVTAHCSEIKGVYSHNV